MLCFVLADVFTSFHSIVTIVWLDHASSVRWRVAAVRFRDTIRSIENGPPGATPGCRQSIQPNVAVVPDNHLMFPYAGRRRRRRGRLLPLSRGGRSKIFAAIKFIE